MDAKTKERERWIKRFCSLFPEPSCLPEYRAGEVTFRELRDRALHSAEMMLAEAQGITSAAFDEEDE
jgi:hypothetical protein